MSNADDDDLWGPDYRSRHPLPTPLADKSDDQIEEMNQAWRSKPVRKRRKSSEMTPEQRYCKNQLEPWLKKHMLIWDRMNVGQFAITDPITGEQRFIQGGKVGRSDYIGLWPFNILGITVGVYTAIEAKVWPNKPTDRQEAFLARVRSLGGIAVVSYTILDVEQAVKAKRTELIAQLHRALTKR